ncbi:16S rRNA (adenine(1518)-N(6)/adenine(1519)-N(6))-dimethyltransferase RsmA [Aerococcus agrisoli]|uniref:Ribosomal RNA small subunit methyltransferase A n=1 Tax=Aerococcus agrisoli TaxID=2487350 RepID=A0A3N4GF17_9LACT|nr:16S rRNA (adenine(1518)-N(6)/adenine(1519)-N(6))-dimethyltransferase RsmA [Aerococcus agrisoli]RPA60785.1 16S rRNA (adenine(1518)-N(6)/adenine(1519)-N(6))-dimethyltransferase RsmA [Aerococcus agrisoli]
MTEPTKYIATPSRTGEILKKFHLDAKKSLGQNFLTEPQILQHMIDVAGVDQDTNAIEIGPGIGALTEFLAINAKEVLAFEIDQRLLPVLADTLAQYDNVTVKHQDILEADLNAEIAKMGPADKTVVVANLPYYITTPIIFNLLEASVQFDKFILMMQKEVAERLTAAPGSKAYGSLSVAIQYYCDAEIAFTVPRTVFNPQPNVDSAILALTKLDTPRIQVIDEAFFFRLVRASFKQRRKTLWNNLRAAFGKEEDTVEKMTAALDEAGLDPKQRAETLTIEDFGKLADALFQKEITYVDAEK